MAGTSAFESTLAGHPHAAAALGSAVATGRPAHAYLFAGTGGSGKRAAARGFAAELLIVGAGDPANARARVMADVHPDLTWVTPSGAHEMLRRDVDEAVIAAASQTPFEAKFRVFVLERAETMNDETANSLLKTLEEPASFAVLILLTDKPRQILPTIRSRCQLVRFNSATAEQLSVQLQAEGAEVELALTCARLSMGDGNQARELASPEGELLRRQVEEFAMAPLVGEAQLKRPWEPILAGAKERAKDVQAELEAELAEELEYLPRKEHRKRTTEYTDRSKRAARRVETNLIDQALRLAALWYRDLACAQAGAPEMIHWVNRAPQLQAQAAGQTGDGPLKAVGYIEETRTRLALNVNFELALEALSYRLQRTVSSNEAQI